MPEFVGTFGEIVEREMRSLTQTTPIKQNVAGSKARALTEVSARELERAGRLMETNLQRAFLPTTSGKFLEHFGATVGLKRYPQRNAETSIEDRCIRFSTRFGTTFGAINAGEPFTIAAGTVLTAPSVTSFEDSRNLEDSAVGDTVYDRSIRYTLTYDAYCASDATEVFAAARAVTPGVLGNLASPGMIKSHSFTNYADYLGKSLLVTNAKPILNGTDVESEASYRYRISKQITAAEKANDTAIIAAALGVPGVADVVLVPYEEGAGRFAVYIKAISSTVSDRLVAAVQEAISKVTASGAIGYARKPYEIGIEIDTNLVWRGTVKEEEKAQTRRSLITSAVGYINSLDLGQPLIFEDLSERLKKVDSRILSVGSNASTRLDAVFGFFPARLADGGKRREKIISPSLVIPTHARIIIEPSLSDPVRFI